MDIVLQTLKTRSSAGLCNRVPHTTRAPGTFPVNRSVAGFRKALMICLVMFVAALLFGTQAKAELTVTPITWDVVGLDHNRPLTSGPQWFPVGARICSDVATTNVEVSMVWAPSSDDAYINNRPGSLTTLTFPSIGAGQCVDAYFEIELTRDPLAFGNFREYTIQATDAGGTAATPPGRRIYIEQLISQNRNTTDSIRFCDPLAGGDCYPGEGGTGWTVVGIGGNINLAVGNRYFIELTSYTSTAYEQLESFVTLYNNLFQVLSVSTTYEVHTAPPERVPQPHSQLWADGCLWDSDPNSPNYYSCLSTGKTGGKVVTLYEVVSIDVGASIPLYALHYDRSGSSFHYNADHYPPSFYVNEFDPIVAGLSKRFTPSTIAAGGVSTMRLTITNPNPVTVSGYNFVDLLPGDMVVADPANIVSNCGGLVTAIPGQKTVSLADGKIGPGGNCVIRVDVTVPFSGTATYPLGLLNTVDLYFGDAVDPSATAEATLEVTATPPPPLECVDLPWDVGTTIAKWTSFTNATTSNPPATPDAGELARGVGTAAGNPVDLTYGISQSQWTATKMNDLNLTDKLANARLNNWYFEFVIDTTYFFGEINTLSITWKRHQNSINTMTLDYGPPPEAGQAWEPVLNAATWTNTANNALQTNTVTNLGNLNPNGNTLFRFYVYNTAKNENQPVSISSVTFTGSGAICEPSVEPEPPVPPGIGKVFYPATVRVNEPSTLTFTLANPNAADALTGVTFLDELPAGMTVVANSFSNNGCGGTWELDSTDPDVLLFSGGTLAARGTEPPEPAAVGSFCTLLVDVVSTSIGDNVNLSDPIDARETLPGNSAADTLKVLPPPATPSIFKFFDPDLLLIPAGSSTLTFRITNHDPDLAIESVAFSDVLPAAGGAQMAPVSPFSYSDNGKCGAGYAFTWGGGTNTLSFSDGEIAAGESCEIRLDVAVPGVDVSGGPVAFPNETSRVSHVFNGETYFGNIARDTLLVDNPIPGISILKQVGLTNDINEAWFTNVVVKPGTNLYYLLIVENSGEVPLSPLTVSDPDVSLSGCTWPATLPVSAVDNDDHIIFCVVGPISALEGTYPNTATAIGKYNGTDYTDDSTAIYKGEQPTAVIMGRVEFAVMNVRDFLNGIGTADLDRDGLLALLRAWDPDTAGRLEGSSRETLLHALMGYLDPDGDGHVVALRWETLEERGTIGFYVERSSDGAWTRINAEILHGLIASPMGAEYWLADPGARPGNSYRYRLIELEARGTTREYGPFDLQVGNSVY
jgi:uncharacterized repeat protein (TIGR01451 family)